MSGIAGIIDFSGAPVDPESIVTMTSAMSERGPDGMHHWSGGSASLGHCLLCTTEESLAEHQPLVGSSGSVVLVMDGRLDNWQELRRELSTRGTALRDRTDATLVLSAYQQWGRDCVHHLDGDFALAIWDADRHTVFCARDRMGRKPFNYHWDGRRLTFASEVQAIVGLPWIPSTLNDGMLAEYLSMEWFSREETPWTGVKRLLPAHWLEIDASGPREACYWQPDLHAPIVYRRDEEYVEHYRHLLADAVRRTSRTHRPLSCEVSGGLDSSAVFAVAARLRREATLPAPDLVGFTLRFDDRSDADELEYARAVATHVGVPVHEVEPTRKPLEWYETWSQKHREFPGYPNGVMGWGIREAARSCGSSALLVGGGGDEWLSGSRDYYLESLTAGHWRHFVDSLATDVRENGVRNTARWVRRACALALLPSPVLQRIRDGRARRREAATGNPAWLAPGLAALLQRRAAIRRQSAPEGARFARPGQAPLFDTLHSAYDLVAHEAEERLASSLGVELRLPLSTPAMVQFAFSTPERLRLRGRLNKHLHRHAVRPLLPATVVERTSKADFMGTFRWHADEVRGAVTGTRRALEDWIQGSELDSALERYGDPASNGVAEWRLWSLMGWSYLRSGLQK